MLVFLTQQSWSWVSLVNVSSLPNKLEIDPLDIPMAFSCSFHPQNLCQHQKGHLNPQYFNIQVITYLNGIDFGVRNGGCGEKCLNMRDCRRRSGRIAWHINFKSNGQHQYILLDSPLELSKFHIMVQRVVFPCHGVHFHVPCHSSILFLFFMAPEYLRFT